MGKKYMLCLLSVILVLCKSDKKEKVVKLQVISSSSEQNIFILVNKLFQHISVLLSRLIGRLFTYLLNINITETCTEEIASSYDEEFRIVKLQKPEVLYFQ